MKHSVAEEFATVDILLDSNAETRAVDAFTISWVKLEKQLRRLTTNLIFQGSIFQDGVEEHRSALRDAILRKKTANHDRFIGAIFRLSGVSVKEMIGDTYKDRKRKIDSAYQLRNKILHGQQTGHSLTRSDLLDYVESIKIWCRLLSEGASAQVGYDGFSRNSLRKNRRDDITSAVDAALAGGWTEFVKRV